MQGAVERANQTIKMKLKCHMNQHNTRIVGAVTDSYNNTVHSVTSLTTNEAWKKCFFTDPERMTNEEIAERLF